MNWRDLSIFYCIAVCKFKRIEKGARTALQPDVAYMFGWIEKYLTTYGKYPGVKMFARKYNLTISRYWEAGWTLKSLADALKLEAAKAKIQDTQLQLQELLLSDDKTLSEYMEPINALMSDMLEMKATKPVKLSSGIKVIKEMLNSKTEDYLKFGFPELDRITGGVSQSDFVVIYADTTQGKSTFSRVIAYNMAAAGAKVLYITLEENDKKSVVKTLATGVQFNSKDVFLKRLGHNDRVKIKQALKELKGDVVFVHKLEARSISEIQQLVQEHQPDIVFLDQLSHFLPKGDFDWKVVNGTIMQLQAFQQNSQIPMVVLHQAAMHQKKVRGAWGTGPEQAADIALYLNHDEKDDMGNITKRLDITKNRDGENRVSIMYTWLLSKGIVEEQGLFFDDNVESSSYTNE